MLSFSHVPSLLLITGTLHTAFVVGAPHLAQRDGTSPSLPYDPRTTQYCSWWVDLTSEYSCPVLLQENFITLDEFRRWNPSIAADCGGLVVGHSYRVEVLDELAPASSASSASAKPTQGSTSSSSSALLVIKPSSTLVTSSSTTALPTTTRSSNGIGTPSPLQPEILSNCDAFYYVKLNENCENIAKANRISLTQFLAWNPKAGSDCSGLLTNVYACVSIIGHTPTSAAPSTTKPGNGIATPSPIQEGIVTNCDNFYMVKSGDTCDKISLAKRITSTQIIMWDSAIGSTCTNLWLNTYICISNVRHTPSTTKKAPATTTKPGNGVNTPTPYQEGMTKSCKRFHLVAASETCATIAAKYSITVANFIKWNFAAGSTCSGLWAKTYSCVAVL